MAHPLASTWHAGAAAGNGMGGVVAEVSSQVPKEELDPDWWQKFNFRCECFTSFHCKHQKSLLSCSVSSEPGVFSRMIVGIHMHIHTRREGSSFEVFVEGDWWQVPLKYI